MCCGKIMQTGVGTHHKTQTKSKEKWEPPTRIDEKAAHHGLAAMSFFRGKGLGARAAQLMGDDGSSARFERSASSVGSAGVQSASSSRGTPRASMHVAGIMSEQQSILTGLRALQGVDGVLESEVFHQLVGRIQAVQQQQQSLIAGNSAESAGAEEQKVLVTQTKAIMDVLTKLTTPSQPGVAPASRHGQGSFNAAAGAAAADFGATPRWTVSNPPPPPPVSSDAPPPTLLPSLIFRDDGHAGLHSTI